MYISVDMEGVAGISHANPTRRGDYGYGAAVELMVGEANAAIEGAFDGGVVLRSRASAIGDRFKPGPLRPSVHVRIRVHLREWARHLVRLRGSAASRLKVATRRPAPMTTTKRTIASPDKP